jgi:transcriptional regulator with XRE-family HTH domain
MTIRRYEQPPFGNRLMRLRQRCRITQSELAELAGLSQGIIQSLEQGQRLDPRLSTLLKLAGALGLTLDELVTEE